MTIAARCVVGGYLLFVVQAVAGEHRPWWFATMISWPFLFAWVALWEKR